MTLRSAREEAALAVLDLWVHAAIAVDDERRIVVMNRTAAALLRRGDGLWLAADGQLRTIDEPRTRALDLAIRSCATALPAIAPDDRNGWPDGLLLPRANGRAPLRAMLSRLPPPADSDLPEHGRRVLLVIIDPDDRPRTPVGWLARQCGLTPAEQRLTEAIINGVPLAEAATQLGIRASTARTRLKAIQVKTGCHRQVDLVRLALSLPQVR